MDLFGKQSYEELDFVTKLTEPVTFSLFDIIVNDLPNEIEMSGKDVLSSLREGYYGISFHSSEIIRQFLTNHIPFLEALKNKGLIASYNICDPWGGKPLPESDMDNFDYSELLLWTEKFFTLEITNINDRLITSENRIICDIEDLKYQFKVKIKKNPEYFASKDFADIPKSITYNIFNYWGITNQLRDKKEKNRVKELIEIIEPSVPNNINHLTNAITRKIINNDWNIKNIDIMFKIRRWIIGYINCGRQSDLNNIVRLKLLTYNKLPIYSFEETI